MKYKLERLEMSGSGPKIMWSICNQNNIRQFPTTLGHLCWSKRKDAKKVLDYINSHGFEAAKKELIK